MRPTPPSWACPWLGDAAGGLDDDDDDDDDDDQGDQGDVLRLPIQQARQQAPAAAARSLEMGTASRAASSASSLIDRSGRALETSMPTKRAGRKKDSSMRKRK